MWYGQVTGYTVRGSSSGGGEISAPIQNAPGAHSASYTMGTGSFLELKRPGRGVDISPSSSAEAKESVELHFYSSGPYWPVIG